MFFNHRVTALLIASMTAFSCSQKKSHVLGTTSAVLGHAPKRPGVDPFPAVVRIGFSSKQAFNKANYGSGVLLKPGLILTAAHVALIFQKHPATYFLREAGPWVQEPGVSSPNVTDKYEVVIPDCWTKLDKRELARIGDDSQRSKQVQADTYRLDLALIVLDPSVIVPDVDIDTMPLSKIGFAANDLISVVGHGITDSGFDQNRSGEKYYGTNKVSALFSAQDRYAGNISDRSALDQVEVRGPAWWSKWFSPPAPGESAIADHGDSGAPGIKDGTIAGIVSHGEEAPGVGVYLNIHDATEGGPGLWLQDALARQGISFTPSGYDSHGNPKIPRGFDGKAALDPKAAQVVEGEIVDVATGQILSEGDSTRSEINAASPDAGDGQSGSDASDGAISTDTSSSVERRGAR